MNICSWTGLRFLTWCLFCNTSHCNEVKCYFKMLAKIKNKQKKQNTTGNIEVSKNERGPSLHMISLQHNHYDRPSSKAGCTPGFDKGLNWKIKIKQIIFILLYFIYFLSLAWFKKKMLDVKLFGCAEEVNVHWPFVKWKCPRMQFFPIRLAHAGVRLWLIHPYKSQWHKQSYKFFGKCF